MTAAYYFGFSLITLSAVLLAQHWQQWRDRDWAGPGRQQAFLRRQLQRRFVASTLIGVVGAAMTLADRVPRTPLAASGYLFGLLAAGMVILAIAITDMAATRRRREDERLAALAEQLHAAFETGRNGPGGGPPGD